MAPPEAVPSHRPVASPHAGRYCARNNVHQRRNRFSFHSILPLAHSFRRTMPPELILLRSARTACRRSASALEKRCSSAPGQRRTGRHSAANHQIDAVHQATVVIQPGNARENKRQNKGPVNLNSSAASEAHQQRMADQQHYAEDQQTVAQPDRYPVRTPRAAQPPRPRR